MKKIILSGISVFSLFCPTLIIFLNQTAVACPIRERETLLSLYKNSEGVYRARFSGEDEGEPKEQMDNARYSIAEASRHFDVLMTYKGKNAEKVTVYEDHYIYRPVAETKVEEAVTEEPQKAEEASAGQAEDENAAEEEPEIETDEDEGEEVESNELKAGDEVLLFVKTNQKSGRIEVTSYGDGMKRLTRDDMAVYEARIKELRSIFAAEKPNPELITDWLVRCAEDPATRWEGAAELQRSFRSLAFKQAQEAKKSKESGETESVEFFGFGAESSFEYAASITEYHRQVLTNAVINSSLANRPVNKKNAFVNGDTELFDLIARWADGRVAHAFLERVRSGGYAPWETAQLMSSVAEILDDRKLESLAERYQSGAWQRDKQRVVEDDMENVDELEATDESGESGLPKVEASPDPSAKSAETVESAKASKPENAEITSPNTRNAKKPVMTYGQLRKDVLEKFLARADMLIFGPQEQADANTAKAR